MGEIGDPQPVRGVRGEVPLDEIGRPCRSGIRPGGAYPLLALDTPYIQPTHQAGDLVAAGSPGRDPQLARPIDAVVGLPQDQQQRHHLRVAHRTRRRRAALGRPIRGGGHLQRSADGLDPETGTIRVDELQDHRCRRSSSAPKKTAARWRISFARRSSRFSWRSFLSSSLSAVETPTRAPASISA